METNSWQLCDDLLSLLSRLKAAIAQAADEHNLTPMQLAALYSILRGEATMGRLANALHCDASNVTGIVDRLVAQKLVTSEAAPHDRRAKVLTLTAAGKGILEAFMAELPTRLGCPFMTDAEGAQLHTLLTKLEQQPSQAA